MDSTPIFTGDCILLNIEKFNLKRTPALHSGVVSIQRHFLQGFIFFTFKVKRIMHFAFKLFWSVEPLYEIIEDQ